MHRSDPSRAPMRSQGPAGAEMDDLRIAAERSSPLTGAVADPGVHAVGALRLQRRGIMLSLGALMAFGPLALDFNLPALPAIAEDLTSSQTVTQMTVSACLLGIALGQIVFGPWSDRVGRRRPMLTAVIAFTITGTLCALAPTMPVLLGLRFLQGVAGAGGIVLARAMVRDLYEGAAAARALTVLLGLSTVVPIVGPILGAQLLVLGGWRLVFLSLAVIGLGVLAAVWTLPETLPEQRRLSLHQARVGQQRTSLFRDRVYVGYLLVQSCTSIGFFTYLSMSPFVVQDVFGETVQVYALLFGINAVGILVLARLGVVLVPRLGSRRVFRLSLSVYAVGGLAFVAVTWIAPSSVVGYAVCTFLALTVIAVLNANCLSLAMTRYPHRAGEAAGWVGVSQYLLGAAASPLAGTVNTGTAMPLAVVIALAGVIAALVVVTLTVERGAVSGHDQR